MTTYDGDKTLNAIWTWNSETGEKILIDLKTGEKICTWVQTQTEGEDDGV